MGPKKKQRRIHIVSRLHRYHQGKFISAISPLNCNGENLIVRGRLRNRYPVSIFGGHVEATLYDPDDNQIAKVSTFQIPRTIRKLVRKRNEESRFKVILGKKPPEEGSRVVVWFSRKKLKRHIAIPH